MTVAIAAITPTAQHQIVTASDAMISFGDFIPSTDEAVMKNKSIAHNWGIMYAATDSTAMHPVMNEIFVQLYPPEMAAKAIAEAKIEENVAISAVQAAYEKEFSNRFFIRYLSRFGFADINEFRREGYSLEKSCTTSTAIN